MSTQDSGSAAGRETAPEGKDPDGPGPGGAAAEGKDGWEGGGGDAEEWTATEARYDELEGMMKEDAFDINMTPCGPWGWTALAFALGVEGDPYDEKAVKLILGVPGLDVNATNEEGRTRLWVECSIGRSRNVALHCYVYGRGHQQNPYFLPRTWGSTAVSNFNFRMDSAGRWYNASYHLNTTQQRFTIKHRLYHN